MRLPSPDRPSSEGAVSKYFTGPLKAKIFFELKTFSKVTDYFNVQFYFSNPYLNFVEHIYHFLQQKIKRNDTWCQISKRFALSLRIRSHELKAVRDFILIENLTSVFRQLFTCVHIN